MRRNLALAVVAATLALLASCQRPLVVVVSPDAEDLLPALKELLSAPVADATWTIQTESQPWPGDATVVRLTTTPGWNLPSATPPAVEIPATWNQADAFVAPSALIRLARNDQGDWQTIPLFFDLWGQTRFGSIDITSTFPLDWGVLLTQSADRTVVMAGSRPSFRQWAFGATFVLPQARRIALSSWFSQTPEGWQDELAAYGPLVSKRLWLDDAWNLSAADVAQSYRIESRTVFLETYRDFGRSRASGVRRFFPFQKASGGGFAVGGIVLSAEVLGDKSEVPRTIPLLQKLTGVAFQRTVGSATGWLAANLNAPELDATGSAARGLINQAQSFLPTTDRLPNPLPERSLMVEVQLTVDRTPRD